MPDVIERQSYCRICPGLCGVVVSIEDNRIIGVKGDRANLATDGYICIKGRQNAEFHHGPNRILTAMGRQADGAHGAIGSEQALDEVADRVTRIVANHGPDAIGVFVGTAAAMNVLQCLMAHAWIRALGSRSVFTSQTIDQSAKWVAECRLGRFASGRQAFADADVWLLAGMNPLVSLSGSNAGIPQYNPLKHLRRARERGLKLIIVDPRRTETAAIADLYLQIIPGEDPTLFAAILREILAQGWHDRGFCDDYVDGLDRLEHAVAPFTLDYAASRSGVPAEKIHTAAAMFARDSRRGMAGSGSGPDMAPRSNLAEHLIQCLNVVCGRFARPGDVVQNPRVMLPRRPIHAEVLPPHRPWEHGHRSKATGYGTLRGEMMSGVLADEILYDGEDRLRALFCVGANPANALPDQRKAVRALSSLDLLVTSEPRWSETARLADYVFAPTLAFERPDHTIFMEIWGMTEPYAQYTPALIDRPAGSDLIDDWYLYWALAKRMGLQLTLFSETLDMKTPPRSDDLLAILAANGAVDYDTIRQAPTGRIYERPPEIVQPPRPGVSARFTPMPDDVAAELAEVFAEPVQSLSAGGRYTHHLVVRRARETVNTLGREFGAIRKRMPTNPLFIHPADMAALELAAGDRVRVTSDNETLSAIVAADPKLRRGVVSMTHGWGGLPGDGDVSETGVSSSRFVTTDAHLDPINAMPRLSAIPVALAKEAAS
jgi:anaerobic selenocysteine-containing dehydrogenase